MVSLVFSCEAGKEADYSAVGDWDSQKNVFKTVKKALCYISHSHYLKRRVEEDRHAAKNNEVKDLVRRNISAICEKVKFRQSVSVYDKTSFSQKMTVAFL